MDSHPITLDIDGNMIRGKAACNDYGGEVSISNGGFTVSDLFVTEMACSPPETMEIESLYLQALAGADRVELRPDASLIISGPDVHLEFEQLEPVPTAELTGTVWVLDGLIEGDVVSSVSGERATLELFTDGSFIGSTGCRDISGSYESNGAEVVFTSWGAHGDCPEDLSHQDSQVISALEGGFRVEIDGDTMITWARGDEGLMYRADS